VPVRPQSELIISDVHITKREYAAAQHDRKPFARTPSALAQPWSTAGTTTWPPTSSNTAATESHQTDHFAA